MKDKMIGVIVTMISSALMFLTYSFFGSFETKADSESRYNKLNNKVDLIICILDKKRCIK